MANKNWKWTDGRGKLWRLNNCVLGTEDVIGDEHLYRIIALKENQRDKISDYQIPFNILIEERDRRYEAVNIVEVLQLLDCYELRPHEFRIVAHILTRTHRGNFYIAHFTEISRICKCNKITTKKVLAFLYESKIVSVFRKINGVARAYKINPLERWVAPEEIKSIRSRKHEFSLKSLDFIPDSWEQREV